MTILHSDACEQLLTAWRALPDAAVPHRLADYTAEHSDGEVRDLLLTIFDEDPADSEPVLYARELWSTLVPSVGDAR